jgi:hypothetical protein
MMAKNSVIKEDIIDIINKINKQREEEIAIQREESEKKPSARESEKPPTVHQESIVVTYDIHDYYMNLFVLCCVDGLHDTQIERLSKLSLIKLSEHAKTYFINMGKKIRNEYVNMVSIKQKSGEEKYLKNLFFMEQIIFQLYSNQVENIALFFITYYDFLVLSNDENKENQGSLLRPRIDVSLPVLYSKETSIFDSSTVLSMPETPLTITNRAMLRYKYCKKMYETTTDDKRFCIVNGEPFREREGKQRDTTRTFITEEQN